MIGLNKELPHATLMPFASKDNAFTGEFSKSPYYVTLNGKWKFNWAKRPAERPLDFFRVRYNDEDWNEITEKYGDFLYQSKGYAKIKALICDDTESIFTPCSYEIEDVTVSEGTKVEQIKKIVSFRGRFCEQVKVGEKILAKGKIEKVISNNDIYHRLLIGNKTSDYIVSI